MKKLLSLFVVAGLAFACTDDDLSRETFQGGDKIVGFESSFSSVAYFEDEGTVLREFPVNLLGLGNGQVSDEPIVINYEIDTEASTATEGVEFDFVDSSGQISIPAGADFGMFPVNVNTGNFNPTAKTQLVLKLTGASEGTVVAEQFKSLRIVFVGCQADMAGSYEVTVTRDDGGVRYFPVDVITETGVNEFHTTWTGTWIAGQLPAASDYGFDFINICGEITVPSQNLGGVYTNLVKGHSTDGIDGMVEDANSFYIDYTVTFAAGDRTFRAEYTRNN